MRKSRGGGARDHHGDGDPGAQPRRRRRMVGDGRDPHLDRLSLPLRRGGDQGRRDDDQPARHGRLRDAGRVPRACSGTVRERVPDSDKAIFSVHCHDDLGLAVANSLAGVEGGARQVECTINGIGERAGNAALEEIVMAIRTRGDVLPYDDRHRRRRCSPAPRKVVSTATSFPVQYNKAIVGRNAFAHESGIHQDGMLKNAQTYEIMTPESVGVSEDLAGHGQAFGPRRVPHQAEGDGLHARRQPVRGRLRPLQGARRPQEARLRRGYRGARRPEHRHRARPHQARLADGHRRHARPAAGDHEARHRRAARHRGSRGQRTRSTRPSTPSRRWCRTRRCSSSTRSTR